MLLAAACSSDSGDLAGESAAASPSPAAAPAATPTALFVLGDSLSDVGNAAAAADYLLNVALDPPTVGLCNPADVLVARRRCDDVFYKQSRVSDGAVAVEHLAAQLGLAELKPSLHLLPNQDGDGTVYAVASAKARGPNDEDLARQVDWLLLEHAPLPADALYVVMIGGNDAIDALQADVASPALLPRPSTAIVSDAVDAIEAEVERLIGLGARRLVVANVPDLAELPRIRAAARTTGDEAGMLAAASAISAAFNGELAASLAAVEARASWLSPAIARFDLAAALSAARQMLAANGANAVDACFDSELYRASSAAERAFHADCAPLPGEAPRFGGFVFFDGIHPSGVTHAALGDTLRALL